MIEASTEGSGILVRTHTILLVEDSEDLRQLMRRMLERCGYTVLPAGDAEDALGIEKRHRGVIHLLISDMIMPGLSGTDLAELIMQRRPAINVLFISGNPSSEAIERFSVHAGFLMKPFPPDALENKVRQCLEARGS